MKRSGVHLYVVSDLLERRDRALVMGDNRTPLWDSGLSACLDER